MMTRRSIIGALAAVVVAGGLMAAPTAKADHTNVIDCYEDVGDPAPGQPSWILADQNNRWCASAHPRTSATNPAYHAAAAANVAQGQPTIGDPFRSFGRWTGVRGEQQAVTWSAGDGVVHDGALFGPLDAEDGPFPGVVVVCHVCELTGPIGLEAYAWAVQTLAEHGYVVFFPHVGDPEGATAATDWFVSVDNPWRDRLDATRLGIAGHSGAAVVALTVGNTDERYDAVVGWDRARSADGLFARIAPRVPTMVQVADYFQNPNGVTPYEPQVTRPVPAPGSKFTDFEAFPAAGIDAMQVATRASTHGDWSGGAGAVQPLGGSLYGEAIATYYTLAWFDRYLYGATDKGVADEALERLTTTATFDDFSDVHQIGAGFFDPIKAQRAGNVEAGNVPVTIGGLNVRNLLSWWYPSRYSLDTGDYACADMRAGCPS